MKTRTSFMSLKKNRQKQGPSQKNKKPATQRKDLMGGDFTSPARPKDYLYKVPQKSPLSNFQTCKGNWVGKKRLDVDSSGAINLYCNESLEPSSLDDFMWAAEKSYRYHQTKLI